MFVSVEMYTLQQQLCHRANCHSTFVLSHLESKTQMPSAHGLTLFAHVEMSGSREQ